MLGIRGFAYLLLVGASAAFAQDGRPAKDPAGLPALKKRTLTTEVLGVWAEGKRPKLIASGKEEVALGQIEGALLPTLNPDLGPPQESSGSAEFARLQLPGGELDVRRVSFSTATDAEAFAGFGVGTDVPALVELRGTQVVVIQGPGLTRVTANGISKLRSAAWTKAQVGLAPATPWSLVALLSGDGDYVLVNRGAGLVHDQLAVTRDTAREKSEGLSADPAFQLAWLDGDARETSSMLLGSSQRCVELYSAASQGSFVMASSWERVEGLKTVLRHVLGRRLPAAPEGTTPADWATTHRKARLSGSSAHPSPVLLTSSTRPVEVVVEGPEQGGPEQGGLTEGVEQGTAPKK